MARGRQGGTGEPEEAMVAMASDQLLGSSDDVDQRLRSILNAMPHMVWSTTADGSTDFYNDVWYQFTGVPRGSTDGDQWTQPFHPDDQPEAWRRWRHSVETGEPYEVEYRLRRHDGAWRWQLGRGRPMRRADGTIGRWIGTCTDIHALKEAEAGLALVAGELTHRIKNMFAVATAMLTLGARRRSADVRQFAEATAARLDALARVQDFIRPGGPTPADLVQGRSSLHALIQALASPHGGDRFGTISLTGQDMDLSASRTTSIVLVLHEMFTNALKYGALSMNDGVLAISSTVANGQLVLEWTERGGPVVPHPPERQGFGSSLREKIVRQQLGGTMELDWRPEGLAAVLRVPLSRLVDQDVLAGSPL